MHVLALPRTWDIDLRDMSFSLFAKNIVNFSKLDFNYGLILCCVYLNFLIFVQNELMSTNIKSPLLMNYKKKFLKKSIIYLINKNHQTTKSITHFILLKIQIKIIISSIKLKQDF